MSGETRIPNEWLEALMSKKLTSTDLQAALALARITWGEGRDEMQVTLAQLADMMSTHSTMVSKAMRRLASYGVVKIETRSGDHSGNVYRLVRNPERWDSPMKTPELKIRVFRRDDHTCVYCGARIPGHMTMDHLVAASRGGSETMPNLVTACEACNGEKSSMDVKDFVRRHPAAWAKLEPLLTEARVRQRLAADSWRSSQDERLARLAARRWTKSILSGEPETGKLPTPEEVERKGRDFICPIFDRPCPGFDGRTAEERSGALKSIRREGGRARPPGAA